MIEEWRPIAGFEGLYEISDLGRVRSLDRKVKRGSRLLTVHGRIMTPSTLGKGYLKVALCLDGEIMFRSVHSLVLQTFVGPRPVGMEGAHNNGVRSDNRLKNLRWDTRSGNFADKNLHGTATVGERHGGSKLTASDVLKIRNASGSHHAIGLHFGVSQSQISRIKSGQNWSSLP